MYKLLLKANTCPAVDGQHKINSIAILEVFCQGFLFLFYFIFYLTDILHIYYVFYFCVFIGFLWVWICVSECLCISCAFLSFFFCLLICLSHSSQLCLFLFSLILLYLIFLDACLCSNRESKRVWIWIRGMVDTILRNWMRGEKSLKYTV